MLVWPSRSFSHYASSWMGRNTHQEIFFDSIGPGVSKLMTRFLMSCSQNWKSDNFCQQLETISSVLPWISPGNTILHFSLPLCSFLFSVEPIDLFIFWSKLSSSDNYDHTKIHERRTNFSRTDELAIKVSDFIQRQIHWQILMLAF